LSSFRYIVISTPFDGAGRSSPPTLSFVKQQTIYENYQFVSAQQDIVVHLPNRNTFFPVREGKLQKHVRSSNKHFANLVLQLTVLCAQQKADETALLRFLPSFLQTPTVDT